MKEFMYGMKKAVKAVKKKLRKPVSRDVLNEFLKQEI